MNEIAAVSVKKSIVGLVISNNMDKTAVVQVNRVVKHSLYGKYIKKRMKFLVHDAENVCKIGDSVIIEESRPISKNKRWRVRKILL